MNYEMKATEDLSRNLDERTGDLMQEVYDEITLSDMLISPQEQTAEVTEDDDNNRTEVVQFRVSKKELERIDRRLEKSSHKSRSSYSLPI